MVFAVWCATRQDMGRYYAEGKETGKYVQFHARIDCNFRRLTWDELPFYRCDWTVMAFASKKIQMK